MAPTKLAAFLKWSLVLLAFLFATGARLAGLTHQAAVQIQQGASGSLTALTGNPPDNLINWEVRNASGNLVGSVLNPNGWSVTYSFTTNMLTVTVPMGASIVTGYQARWFTTTSGARYGNFAVVAGQSSAPPAAPTNLSAYGANASVALSWSASATAQTYTVSRSTTSGGTASVIASGLTTTSYTDTGVANDTTYFYTVTATNTYGTSSPSSEASATPTDTTARFDVSGVTETRAHQVRVSVLVRNAQPHSWTTSWVENGKTYVSYNSRAYYLCTDDGMSDALVIPAGKTTETFSIRHPSPSGPIYGMTGYYATSSSETFTFNTTSTGGEARVFLVSTGGSTVYVDGVLDTTPREAPAPFITRIEKYNIVRLNADAVSVGSRKTYGQPNRDGVLPGDPNADLRNPSYAGWTYKGGLFAGNVPSGSGDLSGTTRIQAYIPSIPTFTNPIWSAFTVIYLGVGAPFTDIPTYTLSVPAATDPNLEVPMAQATWGNAWSLGSAAPRSDLTIDSSIPPGEYACFQNPGLSTKMLIHLKNEPSAISQGRFWRYFANLAYAQASGLITAADAQPRVWVIDRVYKEPAQ